MTTVARIIAVSATVALLSAPAFAQDVAYDVHRGQNFSELRTFSIKETPPADVRASRTAWDSAIDREDTNAAVSAQLQARGLRRDDVHPDVYVTTHREFVTEYYDSAWPGWGYGYWGHYGYGSYHREPVVSSTLFVDVRSAETGQLLWRGISERNFNPTSSPDHHLKRINREVSKMFRNYPSGTVATSGREVPNPTDR